MSLDPVLDAIRPEVGGDCPEPTLQWAALRAARQFCQESRALRRTLVLDIKSGLRIYRLEPNWLALTDAALADRDAVEVIGVKAVEVGGVPYDPAGPEQFREDGGGGLVVIYEPNVVEIFPSPPADVPSGLKVSAVLRPKREATLLPERLTTMYCEQIARGAIAVLKGMYNESWSDSKGAADKQSEFVDDIGIARARADIQGRPRGFHVKCYP